MYVHHLGLYCILFRRFVISTINIALQLTKLWLKKVTTTTTTTSCSEKTGRDGTWLISTLYNSDVSDSAAAVWRSAAQPRDGSRSGQPALVGSGRVRVFRPVLITKIRQILVSRIYQEHWLVAIFTIWIFNSDSLFVLNVKCCVQYRLSEPICRFLLSHMSVLAYILCHLLSYISSHHTEKTEAGLKGLCIQ